MQHGHKAERSSHDGVIQHAQGKPSDSHLDVVTSGSTRPLALQVQPPHVADDRAGDTIWPHWLWETGAFVRCLHGHKLCVDASNPNRPVPRFHVQLSSGTLTALLCCYRLIFQDPHTWNRTNYEHITLDIIPWEAVLAQ